MRVNLTLNERTDAAVIKHLASIKNKNDYIRRLILNDIESGSKVASQDSSMRMKAYCDFIAKVHDSEIIITAKERRTMKDTFISAFDKAAAGVDFKASHPIEYPYIGFFFRLNSAYDISTKNSQFHHFKNQLDSIADLVEKYEPTQKITTAPYIRNLCNGSHVTFKEIETILNEHWMILKEWSVPYRLLVDLARVSILDDTQDNLRILEDVYQLSIK